MNINLAEDAVHALNRSAAAAARDGLTAVEPRHILAGVLSEGHEDLLRVCESAGLDLADLPSDLLDVPSTYEGHLPFTPASHQVLEAAVELSGSREDPATTSVHLLAGVAAVQDLDASSVLEAWGLDEGAVTRALDAEVFAEDGHQG